MLNDLRPLQTLFVRVKSLGGETEEASQLLGSAAAHQGDYQISVFPSPERRSEN